MNTDTDNSMQCGKTTNILTVGRALLQHYRYTSTNISYVYIIIEIKKATRP